MAYLVRLRYRATLEPPCWTAGMRVERDGVPLFHATQGGDGWSSIRDQGNQRGCAPFPEMGQDFRHALPAFALSAVVRATPRGAHYADLVHLRGFNLDHWKSARARIQPMLKDSKIFTLDRRQGRIQLREDVKVEFDGDVPVQWLWPRGRARIPLAEYYEGTSIVEGVVGADTAPPWRMRAWFDSDYPTILGRYEVEQEGTAEQVRGTFAGDWVGRTHIGLSYRGLPPHDAVEFGSGVLEAYRGDDGLQLVGRCGGNPLPQDRQPNGHPITLSIRLRAAQTSDSATHLSDACSSERERAPAA